MSDEIQAGGYAPRERVMAGVMCGVLILVACIMADIACGGAIAARLGGSPAEEAERITREAVQ